MNSDRRKKRIEMAIEYAIQVKTKDGYMDYSIYNRRTCLWKKPIEEWPSEIINGYEYKRCSEKYRSTRLVKRTKTEEVIFKGGEKCTLATDASI